MTNQQPHNSLTASWDGRSREWDKIRGNRITYPLIFMTSSNITLSLSLSLFHSSSLLPLLQSHSPWIFFFFKTHSISSTSPFSFFISPIHRLHRRFPSVRSASRVPASGLAARKQPIHPKKDISIRSTASTTANTPTLRHVVYLLNHPRGGLCVLFFFFLSLFSFPFLSLIHPCISFRTLIRVPHQAKAALQDNRAVT